MNSAPQQPNNLGNTSLQTLQAEKEKLLEEVKELRIKLGEVQKNDDGNPEKASWVAGTVKGLTDLINDTEEKIINVNQEILTVDINNPSNLIDVNQKILTADINSPSNGWSELGATGGNTRRDTGQSGDQKYYIR